jgi:uncharacterized protein YjdB
MCFFLSIMLIISSIPDVASADTTQRQPVTVSGDFMNIDFNVTNPSVTNGVYTLDSKILGTVTTASGSNSAGRVVDSDGSSVFYMEANTGLINSFKSAINKTDRFGIQSRVKFNNTTSIRSFFEVKSMTPPTGTAAWPTLLTFDELGRVKDSKNNIISTYAADQWIDIVVDMDSPNHRYSAWINGTLVVDNVDLGNFVGVLQNKMIQNKNAFNAPSRTSIAYVKAGTITDPVPLTGLSIQPLSGDFFVNQTTPVTLVKTPSNTSDLNYSWVSSNAGIVQVDNQGVVTGISVGTAQITVSSILNPSITGSIAITVKAMPAPILINPTLLNADYNTASLQVNNNVVTVDSSFVGSITTTAGSNSAGTTSDGDNNVLVMEAVNSGLNSYKSAMNKTGRFGIQTRVKFNNTNSSRSLFEMKSMNPPTGTPAWPTLLVFDQSGSIKDYKGNVLGTYVANQWYDIVIDMDSANHRYSVWINSILKVNNLDLGNYVGVLQNKIIQNTNAGKTASRTSIAYMKVGDIVPPVQELVIADMSVDKGRGAVLKYQTVPDKAFVDKVTWTSSNPSVAKLSGNGLLALNTGSAMITATESSTGVSTTFQVTVQEPAHIWSSHAISPGNLAAVLTSSYRPELNYSFEQIMTSELQAYTDMNDSDFIQAVQEASSNILIPDLHTKFENYARLFTQLYKLTNDSKYARKAALILYYQALDYPRIVANTNYTDFWGGNYQFPQDAVYAYGSLIDSDIWGQLVPNISSSEVKQSIEELWLKPGAYENIRLVNSMRLNNITPYGGRSSVVTGMLLNDPNMIREIIDIYDRLMNGDNYLFDGMWYEETTSYGDQAVGNVKTTVDVLKDWTDPAGYVDTRFGLHLNNTDLSPRWPLLQMSLGYSTDKMIYPDGKAIPVNDTYGKTGDPQPLPIVDKGLKNIELPGLGYYGLFQGDTNEATHAGLLYQPTDLGFSGGHTHTNFLSLDLWGAGIEILPYTGYLNRTTYGDGSGATLRYPSMRPLWRNMPWVWRQDGANTTSTDVWGKPALLAYDSGEANGKQVQLVEGSDPGPEGKGALMNRRLLMMVNLDGNRNYTFDLTRMQGGQAHEIYQRGAELENMDVQVDGIQLADTGKANLQEYLTGINSTEGLSTDRNLLMNPKVGNGDSSFSFTWTGQQTGASIRTFMNAVDGSNVFLSSIPTARRIETKADESNYVTPHLTRRHIVSASNQITQFGAVHEIYRQGQSGEVSNVGWFKTDDADPMTNIAVVTSEKYKDIIYTSGDTNERNFDGINFAGNIALARFDAVTGNLLFSYVYGTGKVVLQNDELIGYDTQQLEITAATTASLNIGLDPEVRGNTITVKGKISNSNALIGQFIQTKFADGSGYGLKVVSVTELSDNTVIGVENFNPFRVTDQGVETLFFPMVSIPGKAYVIVNLPKLTTRGVPPVTDNPDTVISTDALLSDLNVDQGTLAFDRTQLIYNLDVPNSVGSFNLTIGKSHPSQSLSVTGATYSSVTGNVYTYTADLQVGPNLVGIFVTAEDGTATNLYQVTVSRAAPALIIVTHDEQAVVPESPVTVSNNIPVSSNNGNLTLPMGKEGEVSLNQEITVKIPAQASVIDLKITIEKVLDNQKLLTGKEVLASPIFEILKNVSENFSKPVTLTFDFDKNSLHADQKPAVFYFDEIKKVWVGVPGSKVEGSQITVDVNHFTKFAVFAVNDKTTVSEKPTVDILSNLSDISGYWAETDIQAALKAGIVQGYEDGTFRPNHSVSRAEFVVMLTNALYPNAGAVTLPDYADANFINDWAKQAIALAAKSNLVQGYEDGSFRPGATLTRAQLAVILANTLGTSAKTSGQVSFADAADIPAWGQNAVGIVQEAGLMNGYEANRFSPTGEVTRAEAVTVTMRLLRMQQAR